MSLLAFLPLIGTVLERVLPDPKAADEAKLRMLEMAQKSDSEELNAELQVILGQLKVNEAEASSGNVFVGGWRPAIGWTCAAALFAYYVPYCLVATVVWAMQCWTDGNLVPRPDLGIADLIGLVTAMLGIAGMRTKERLSGVIPKGK